jgi:hypothetical protein
VVPIREPHSDEALALLRGTLIGGESLDDFDTRVRWEATRR